VLWAGPTRVWGMYPMVCLGSFWLSDAMDTQTQLVPATLTGRNRAIDLYRVVAMVFVAIGHWLVIAIGTDADGKLFARNALEVAPQFGPATWLFQVMPLFFAVGGFASAMSLDAHRRKELSDGDWIVQRLRRLVAPTVVLALVWLGLLLAGAVVGAGGLVATGAVGAAIPLWFLANYTIDTALAPRMLTALRVNRRRTMTLLLGLFAIVEVLHVVLHVPYVEHVNWVLGWLLFQMIGFLWRDDALPTGRRLLVVAGGLWIAAIALVALGPWSPSMIHVAGSPLSPTHPPSIALVLFGLAQTATAVAVAPRVTRWLERSTRAWSFVVVGNSMSMSVYLWHFTAAVIASAVLYAVGMLPSAEIGTSAWWVQKLPVLALSLIVLTPIVAVVGRFERRALLADRVAWQGSGVAAATLAVLVSTSIKVWSLGNVGGVVVGSLGVVGAAVALRTASVSRRVKAVG
jgi:peptidoglycan/LPS O-acetylase OafA/YrhL